MDELLPCPVCGSHPVHHTNVSTPLTEDWCRWVGCVDESCLAGPYRRTQTEAIAAWNTLSRAARLLAAVEGLEMAIHSYDQYDVVFWGGTAQFARIDRFNEVETKATGATQRVLRVLTVAARFERMYGTTTATLDDALRAAEEVLGG